MSGSMKLKLQVLLKQVLSKKKNNLVKECIIGIFEYSDPNAEHK